MKQYQKDLIDLMVKEQVLSFGEFTLKSGRLSPYFINTGKFSSGSSLAALSSFYAQHIVDTGLSSTNYIFGPAYKGIPLAVGTAIALQLNHNINLEVLFDRKEAKDHGEKGTLIGKQPAAGQRLVIIDDVITAGTTVSEMLPMLRAQADINIEALVVLVDRCEKGKSELSAVQEVRRNFDLNVSPLITIYDIMVYLSSGDSHTCTLSGDQINKMEAYLEQYGVPL